LVVVLRAQHGDLVVVVDSSGRAFDARVGRDGQRVSAVVQGERASPRTRSLELVLAQAVPKGAKMDYVIEKATEMGVARVVPFFSERTIGVGARSGKLERWRRVAKSASAQCGRNDVPHIEDVRSFDDLLASFAGYDRAIVPWELAEPVPLRERLPGLLEGVRRVVVAIGPEGGLSHDEAGRADAAGGQLVSLGARILRTETAGLVACAIVTYASGTV